MKNSRYKFGFCVSALIVFALIMLPNIIWFCVPSPSDILRNESSTQILDIFMSVFQAVAVAALCLIKNTKVYFVLSTAKTTLHSSR